MTLTEPYRPAADRAGTAPVSLCIVSNRPDELLGRIIAKAAPWFGEILIGLDGHPAKVPSYFDPGQKARIVPLTWEGYGITKNKLAAQARYPWILSLDGDELPDDTLLEAISLLPFATLSPCCLYSLKRRSFFEGREIRHGAWGRDRVVRLYHRDFARWNDALVHESLETPLKAAIAQLPGLLLHYTADDYPAFLEKSRKYARLSAEKYFARGRKSPFWKRIFSPAFTFLCEYLFMGGWRDGRAGYRIARINALYTGWKYAFLKEKYQEKPD